MPTLLIDGQWRDASDGQTIDVINPCDAKPFTTIDRGTAADIDAAVKAAQKALDGAWGRMTATERGRILMKFAELIVANADEIAQIEARDTGKPMTVARNDIVAVARYFEFYGSAADKIHGEQIPYLNGYNVQVVRVPHGVTAHIIPWNYPAQMFGRTLAPALAMGNACVLKPSEELMQIVPLEDELVVEARVRPADIAFVKLGQPASVKIDAYDYTIYGWLDGRVSYISPDTLTEDLRQGEQAYYRVQVKAGDRSFSGRPGQSLDLQPGMTATVEVKTGSNTVLRYLAKPIIKTMRESLVEK